MISSPKPAIRRSKSLHEQVYETLRAAILSGDICPGERLVETQLAEWLQVSRTPLREALRQLQQDGLVAADAHSGLRVITMSVTDAIELYDCRLALEQLSITSACTQATPDQLEQLATLVVAAETSVPSATAAPAPTHLLDLDYKFHHLIAESAGNRRLISLLDQVFDSMALLRIQTLQHNPEVLDIRLEHRQIYEAILSRDTDRAKDAIDRHLSASKARVVREIEVFQQSQP